jgi:hypothetical protein
MAFSAAARERARLDHGIEAFVKVGREYGILGTTNQEVIERYGL